MGVAPPTAFSLWIYLILPISGALRPPWIQLTGERAGSVTIRCPAKQSLGRKFLCRESHETEMCNTVVSTTQYVGKDYKNRVKLTEVPQEDIFLVELGELTQSDTGLYACGTGLVTDRGKTLWVSLSVIRGHSTFREMVPVPKLLRGSQLRTILPPPWLRWSTDPSTSQLRTSPPPPRPADTSPAAANKPVTTKPQRTTGQRARHGPSTLPGIIPFPTPRTPSAAAKQPALPPSPLASRTQSKNALSGFRTASFAQHTNLHRYRQGDKGFPTVLIPIVLAFLLLMILVIMLKKKLRRKRALSSRISRLAVRMSELDPSRRPMFQRARSQRPLAQNNIYSACPRRPQGGAKYGERDPSSAELGAPAASALDQVPKTLCHQSPQKPHWEYPDDSSDSDSDDYVNIPVLATPLHCSPRPDLPSKDYHCW